MRANSQTKDMERGWKRRVRLGIDVFSSRLTLFARGGSDVRALKKRFEGKTECFAVYYTANVQHFCLLQGSVFFALPDDMAMGCCIMWQEALRVRSQLTRYVPKPCNFTPLNINMCLLASLLWLVDSLPNSLIFRFNTLLWKLILVHVFISTLFSLSLCIVNYDSEHMSQSPIFAGVSPNPPAWNSHG